MGDSERGQAGRAHEARTHLHRADDARDMGAVSRLGAAVVGEFLCFLPGRIVLTLTPDDMGHLSSGLERLAHPAQGRVGIMLNVKRTDLPKVLSLTGGRDTPWVALLVPGTIGFLLITGNRLPSYLGSSFAFIAVVAVSRQLDRKAMADALRPIFGETPGQREKRHRRFKLPPGDRMECDDLDSRLLRHETATRGAAKAAAAKAEADLFDSRKRYRELRC